MVTELTGKMTFVGVVLLGLFGVAVAINQGITSIHYIPRLDQHQFSRTTTGATLSTQALVGEKAFLPCDLTPSTPNDSEVLVVWYKDEHTPIFSYDKRGELSTNPKSWSDKIIENRTYFLPLTEPSTLSIDKITEADEGEYRCRIDYLKSPTKNVRVRLNVIVPPGPPTIMDANRSIISHVTAPYMEGEKLRLICVVKGGKPRPSIKWWHGGKLLETKPLPTRYEGIYENELVINSLQKSHQGTRYTCQASNNNISQPLSATISLDLYFRPSTVQILTSDQPLSAGRSYEYSCQTYGSRPPARISWFLDGKELKPPKHSINTSVSYEDNSTISVISITVTKTDNNRTLTCRATNPRLKKSLGIEDNITLTVYYVPDTKLSLGSNLNPADIEEGDDVYFECIIDANPEAYKVVWKHNNQVIQEDHKSGKITRKDALVLQGATRKQAGNYSCDAFNVEGNRVSNVVQLKIMYTPLCRNNQKTIYAVAKHELVNISCEVDAYPPPDKFEWSFNHSQEITSTLPLRYEPNDQWFSSLFLYTPKVEMDYGPVMCWASNLAGKQREPCIFHVIGASKPDPLHNCTIVNRTNDSLEVECIEGYDGGHPQSFFLEVYDGKTNAIQANVSSKFPLFIVSGLDPGKELKMLIYAANSKGRSDPVLVEGFTLKVAEKQTVLSLGTRDQIEIAPVLGILVGIVTAVLLITVIILVALKVRRSRLDGRALRPRFLAVKDKVTLPLRSESEDLFEKDDKNPDVVPSTNKDSDYQLGSAEQTPGLNNSLGSVSVTTGLSPPSSPPSVTPLAEAYMARNRNFTTTVGPNNEVVYAELQLARPNSLDPIIKNGGQQLSPAQQYATLRKGDESTIYTKIDHGRRPPPPFPNSRTSPIISPVTAIFPTSKQGLYHREVVTVRTPLMGCHQESCV